MGDSTWISVSYLNIVVHNYVAAIVFSPEELSVVGDDLGKVTNLSKQGKMLSKISEWLDYCAPIGEVLFAPSKENSGVWLAKVGNGVSTVSTSQRVGFRTNDQIDETRLNEALGEHLTKV